MSCGHLCQCQLSWPLDTVVFKRDPINSEKAWLDFTVRLLSREVVGKGKGQETVWSDKCKPVWWDSAVGLAWKNPTTNPKDTKDVLQLKYSALEKCLRDEGRFPIELEEEARLWGEGKVKELYLQTTLSSLLGKVTSLHCAVDDACKKVKEMNAKVNNLLVSDITKCLKATLRATENLQRSDPIIAKRPCSQDGKENCISGPPKCRKVEPIATLPSKPSLIDRQAQQAPSQKATSEILAMAQKLMDKRGQEKSPTVKTVKRIVPKPQLSKFQPVVIPVLNLSSLQLNHLLQTIAILSSPQRDQSIQTRASSLNMANVNVTFAGEPGLETLDFLHQSDLALNNSEAHSITQLSMPIPSVLPSMPIPSVLPSCWEDTSSSLSPSSNDTSPMNSVIGDPFCVSPNSSFASPSCNTNFPPSVNPPTDSTSSASNSLSRGPSSHEDSLSSFLLSNESSNYAQTYSPSISPHLGNGGGLDSLGSIDISVFDNLALYGDFDRMLDLPERNDCKSTLEKSLSEEDGSRFLEKYLQDL